MTQIVSNFKKIFTSANFYVPVIICLLLIVLGNVFKSGIHKKMKITLLNIGCVDIDGWSISHLILYSYFGYHFPDYFAEFLIIGAVWELFESFFCKESLNRFIGCQDSNNKFCRTLGKLNSCDYWYGKVDDVVVNMIGFVFGAWLKQRFS